MNKTLLVFLIVFLVVFTTLIKNSSKNLEDKIFIKKENIRILTKEVSDLLLEYNYLSSAEQLLKHQSRYFEEQLVQKNLNEFEIIKNIKNKIEIKKILKNQDEQK